MPARALEACGAPILDGFDEDWALEARDEHAHRLAGALEPAAAGAIDPAEAVRLTRAQVALDPLAEAPNRRLIERLAAGGDRAAALSAGRQFAERLRAQLGIAASRETRALLDDLRRGDPPPVSPPPGLSRAHESEFVGRRAELERLRASWAGVQMHRDRRIVLVAGEPGVGKTRLAHQFGGRRARRETRPSCSAAARRSHWRRSSRSPRRSLRPASPTRSSRATPDDTGARHRLFDAVDSALTDLAARAPLLLVIDDLHWADHGTLLLTSFLLRSSRPGPILVLGTYRDTEVGRRTPLTSALAELRRGGALDRVDLRGLTARRRGNPHGLSCWAADEIAPRVHSRTGRQRVLRRGGVSGSWPSPGRRRCRRASGTRSASGCRA